MQFKSLNFNLVGIIFHELTSVCFAVFTVSAAGLWLLPQWWTLLLQWRTLQEWALCTCRTEETQVSRQQRKHPEWLMAREKASENPNEGPEESDKSHTWVVPFTTLMRIGDGRKVARRGKEWGRGRRKRKWGGEGKKKTEKWYLRISWYVQKLDLTGKARKRIRELDGQERS